MLVGLYSSLYDGYANAYSFVKDGVKVKLTPLPPNKVNERNKESRLLVSLVTKEKFPNQPNDCLSPKDNGPINENAYEVEMQGTYGLSNTFNVVNISPIFG